MLALHFTIAVCFYQQLLNLHFLNSDINISIKLLQQQILTLRFATCWDLAFTFYRTQVYPGSDLWGQVSVRLSLTDVLLI